LVGRDFHPLGSIVRFQVQLMLYSPPHPGFAWRNDMQCHRHLLPWSETVLSFG